MNCIECPDGIYYFRHYLTTIFAGEDSHSSSEDAAQDPNKAWKSLDEGGGLGVAGLAAQLSLPPSNLEFGQSAVSNGRGVWT